MDQELLDAELEEHVKTSAVRLHEHAYSVYFVVADEVDYLGTVRLVVVVASGVPDPWRID